MTFTTVGDLAQAFDDHLALQVDWATGTDNGFADWFEQYFVVGDLPKSLLDEHEATAISETGGTNDGQWYEIEEDIIGVFFTDLSYNNKNEPVAFICYHRIPAAALATMPRPDVTYIDEDDKDE